MTPSRSRSPPPCWASWRKADAYVETGGCLGPPETDPSFSPEELGSLEEHLDRLIADTPLPPDGA